MTAPHPRSLILDLLTTLRRGSMPVAALVRAGTLFGIAEGSLRVALSRLLAEGRVERDERGRYRLGAAAEPIRGVVGAWRHLDRRTRPWNGDWIGVHGPERGARRGPGRRPAQALRLLGFERLAPGLRVRPANRVDGVDGVRATLVALGLPDDALVFELGALDPDTDARARGLWDAAALDRGYRDSREKLLASAARLPGLSEEEAMVESFREGGRVIQQLVLDPLLPEPLVDVEARRALVETLRDYDRLGRDAWAGFLGRYDVPHRSAPADTGLAASAGRWAVGA